jgi:hypothetical protein
MTMIFETNVTFVTSVTCVTLWHNVTWKHNLFILNCTSMLIWKLNWCDTLWHYVTLWYGCNHIKVVTSKLFQLIGPSNDGQRHGIEAPACCLWPDNALFLVTLFPVATSLQRVGHNMPLVMGTLLISRTDYCAANAPRRTTIVGRVLFSGYVENK